MTHSGFFIQPLPSQPEDDPELSITPVLTTLLIANEPMLQIYVDADACPVKQEIYKVAKRYDLSVTLVSNSHLRLPTQEKVDLVIVEKEGDAADNWIVSHCQKDDIVITADIPLAAQCLRQESRVITPSGKVYTENNIGAALATRDLLTDLRGAGAITGGPSSFAKRDRSQFLQALDRLIQEIRRV